MTTSLYNLMPGTRVVVRHGHLSGLGGVVVDLEGILLNGHDCAVELDYDGSGDQIQHEPWPGVLCFYAHELAVEK